MPATESAPAVVKVSQLVRVVQTSTLCEEAATIISSAQHARNFWGAGVEKSPMFDPEKEFLVLMVLNKKGRVTNWHIVSMGTQSSALVHPREVFRPAIALAAAAIIVAHNHPSGDPAPSSADIHITRVLKESAKILEIPLMDHVIMGKAEHDPMGKGHYSFREAGIL